MSKVSFDPTKWAALLADLQALGAQVPLLAKTVEDLIALFKTPVAMASPPVKCDEACCCCEEAIKHQVAAIAAMVHCHCCCEG